MANGVRETKSWRRVKRNASGVVGLALLGTILLLAFGDALFGGTDPNQVNLRARLLPPGSIVGDQRLLLGSDQLGRDLLSRTLHGTRVSLSVALIGSILAAVFGTSLGISAAYAGGWWAAVVNRVVDIQHSIPLLVVAVAILAVFDPSWSLIVVLLVLWAWVPFARIAWGASLSVQERDFVAAAKSLGAHSLRIMVRHILPNIATALWVMWTFQFAYLIIIESSLSFLGVGIPPPTPSLGRMLREASGVMDVARWLSIYPGLALVATVVSINLIGDWLSDHFSK